MQSISEKLTSEQKILFADAIINGHEAIFIWQLAQILRQNGYKTSEYKLKKELHKRGYLMECGIHKDMPTNQALKAGLLQIKQHIIYRNNEIIIKCMPEITGKGQVFFVNLFLNSLKGGEK